MESQRHDHTNDTDTFHLASEQSEGNSYEATHASIDKPGKLHSTGESMVEPGQLKISTTQNQFVNSEDAKRSNVIAELEESFQSKHMGTCFQRDESSHRAHIEECSRKEHMGETFQNEHMGNYSQREPQRENMGEYSQREHRRAPHRENMGEYSQREHQRAPQRKNMGEYSQRESQRENVGEYSQRQPQRENMGGSSQRESERENVGEYSQRQPQRENMGEYSQRQSQRENMGEYSQRQHMENYIQNEHMREHSDERSKLDYNHPGSFSHRRYGDEHTRDYATQKGVQPSVDRFHPDESKVPSQLDNYSVQKEAGVPSLGQTYITHHQGHNPVPVHGNIQHGIRTGSTTHTSRSPVSLPSPESGKSTTFRQLETSSTSRSDTNKSSLIPAGLRKTSTPYKAQQTNRASLPAGTTASTSKLCSPNRFSSHDTSMQSEGVVCRICHDGDRTEVLISPCYCAGSMGLLHVSCLQRWLGSSNKTSCEICNFQFALKKKTMPISQFFKEPGTARDRKNVICDFISLLLITPLTFVIAGICVYGATHYYADRKTERSGLIGLAVSVILLYIVWFMVALRHNWRLWKDWKMFHQEVTLSCTPFVPGKQATANKPNVPATENLGSRSTLGSIHLQSIKVNVSGPMARYAAKKTVKGSQRTKASQRASSRASDHSRTSHGQSQSRRHPLPSVSQSVHSKNQDGHFQQLQEENQPIRPHVKGKTNNKDVMAENKRYYNTEERREDKGKQIRKEYLIQHCGSRSDRQSQHSGKCSSVCSSALTDEKQQHRKSKTVIGTHDQIREGRSYINTDRQSSLTNMGNMSTSHRRDTYKKSDNTCMIHEENSPSGCIKPAGRQVKAGAVFSRGGSPPEEETFHNAIPYDDFVTKWINDQTNVLNKENRRTQNRDSINSRSKDALDMKEISRKGKHPKCEPSRDSSQPNALSHPGTSKGTERNVAKFRKPATLSISSSDISFGQIIKENNLENDSDSHFNQLREKL